MSFYGETPRGDNKVQMLTSRYVSTMMTIQIIAAAFRAASFSGNSSAALSMRSLEVEKGTAVGGSTFTLEDLTACVNTASQQNLFPFASCHQLTVAVLPKKVQTSTSSDISYAMAVREDARGGGGGDMKYSSSQHRGNSLKKTTNKNFISEDVMNVFNKHKAAVVGKHKEFGNKNAPRVEPPKKEPSPKNYPKKEKAAKSMRLLSSPVKSSLKSSSPSAVSPVTSTNPAQHIDNKYLAEQVVSQLGNITEKMSNKMAADVTSRLEKTWGKWEPPESEDDDEEESEEVSDPDDDDYESAVVDGNRELSV